ncbi:MAG: hypothetical protein IJH37_09670 [Clostridia bacterium]|nr:hypothetical protein [Clostridia bacterium]
MKAIDLKLRSGHFTVICGTEPAAKDIKQSFLTYTENDTWYAACDPESGILYNSKITLPAFVPESVTLAAADASVAAAPICSGTISVDLRNSSAELELRARRIICRLGRGNATIKAAPSIAAVFECGNGSMDIFLPRSPRGYRYSIVRGAGSVIINSIPAGRNAAYGPEGGIPVNIKCGLGTVNIMEYQSGTGT